MISRSWPFNAKGQRIFVLASTSEGPHLPLPRERWVYVARNESALSPVTPGPASSLKRWRCTSFYPRHLSRLRHLWQIRIGSAKYIYHTSFRREFLFLEQPFSLVPITRYLQSRSVLCLVSVWYFLIIFCIIFSRRRGIWVYSRAKFSKFAPEYFFASRMAHPRECVFFFLESNFLPTKKLLLKPTLSRILLPKCVFVSLYLLFANCEGWWWKRRKKFWIENLFTFFVIFYISRRAN